MLSRIEKSYSIKTVIRLTLIESIKLSGSIYKMSYTRCFRQNLAYKMNKESSRYSEYIHVNRLYDGTFVASFRKYPSVLSIILLFR
jgi:hypothetical protein